MTESFLQIQIKSKHYSKKQVLVDIDLGIEKGEVLAILGASGSGKTTLARCLAGFEDFEGTIRLESKDVTQCHPKDRRVGIVPQDGSLFPHLNVQENVGFAIKDRKGKQDRINELLKIVELHEIEEIGKKKVDQLSGGQQQRVAVARALSGNPAVIILDESFNSLDRWLRITVRKQILESIKSTNTTVIVITHDISEAFELADRVAVLEQGQLVQVDDCENLYARPKNIKVAQLVGVANVVDYEAQFLGNQYLDFSKNGERKCILIRPEQIEFFESSKHEVPIEVELKSKKTNGPSKHSYLETTKSNIVLMSTDVNIASLEVGDVFNIGIDSQAIIYDKSD